jgi:Ankyrin repeats (3 copies)
MTVSATVQRLRAWAIEGSARKRLELAACALTSVALVVVADRAWHPQTRHLSVAVLEQAERGCELSIDTAKVSSRLEALEKDASLTDFSVPLRPFRVCIDRDHQAGYWLPSALLMAAHAGRLRSVRWLFEVSDFSADDLSGALAYADNYPRVIDFFRSKDVKDPTLTVAAQQHASNAIVRLLENRQLGASELTSALPLYLASYTTTDSHGESIDQSAKTIQTVQSLVAKGARANGEAIAMLCLKGETTTAFLLDLLLANREFGAVESALGQMTTEVSEELVRRVASEGIDWSYRDGEDDAPMPLVKAVQARNEVAVRVLLELKAPVNRSYKNGSNALQVSLACGEGNGVCDRITEMLLTRGAEPNKRFLEGTTPLFAAAESGSARQIRALLEHGARMEDRVVRETALDAAERVGNVPAARILSAHGARLSPQMQMNGQFGR